MHFCVILRWCWFTVGNDVATLPYGPPLRRTISPAGRAQVPFFPARAVEERNEADDLDSDPYCTKGH